METVENVNEFVHPSLKEDNGAADRLDLIFIKRGHNLIKSPFQLGADPIRKTFTVSRRGVVTDTDSMLH